MSKTLKQIFIMSAGVISIILSIWCFVMSTGNTSSKNTYGGDAYTGMQNASAQAATNIVDLASITKKGFGCVLLVAGIVLVIVGIPESKANKNRMMNPGQPAPMNRPPMNMTNGQYGARPNNVPPTNGVNNQPNIPTMTQQQNVGDSSNSNVPPDNATKSENDNNAV